MARAKRKSRARRKPAPPPAYGGDHGTSTLAATVGTVIEPMTDENGKNPNNIARRRRLSAIESMTLTMRQEQAAKAIEAAWCRVKMLESGGPLKEQVDASSKPDAVVTAQVEAQSRWVDVTSPLLRSDRKVVDPVCCHNIPITYVARVLGEPKASERFKLAMDRVADHLRY